VNRFTPTQIINAAILTCDSASGDANVTSCVGPKLNGMDIAAGTAGWFRICTAVTGAVRGGSFLTSSGPAAIPNFIWNGSNWALSSASAGRVVNIGCTLTGAVVGSPILTRRFGAKLKVMAR
jgi:hypothetical protein